MRLLTAPPAEAGAPTGERSPLGTAVRRILGVYALSRLVVLLAGWLVGLTHPGFGIGRFLSVWDGGWYLEVVKHGYPHGVPEVAGRATESTIAFFPLFPMTVRAVSWLLPGSDLMAALVVSAVCGAVATVLVFHLVRHLAGARTAERAAMLFAFFPGSFVLSMAYTEALMLALAAGCFLALFRRRWLLAGVLAALATASRPTALALAFACAWEAGFAIWRRREWRALIAPTLAPTGTIAFFLFLKVRTGELGAWFRVEEEGWGQGPKLGLSAFRPVGRALQSPFSHGTDTMLLLGLAFAVVALGLLVWQRWPGSLLVYTTVILAMGANSRLDSVRPRSLLTVFPLVLATARWAEDHRRFRSVLVGSCVLLFVLAMSYNTFKLEQI